MDKLYSVVVVLLLYICLASTEGSEDISSFDEPELYRGKRQACSAPSLLSELVFSEPSRVHINGRDRWLYTVTWQAPDPNCESIVSYTTRYPSYSEGIVEGTETSREITVDGDAEVAFYVTSKNNERFSSAVFSQSIRTPSLSRTTTSSKETPSCAVITEMTEFTEVPLEVNAGLVRGLIGGLVAVTIVSVCIISALLIYIRLHKYSKANYGQNDKKCQRTQSRNTAANSPDENYTDVILSRDDHVYEQPSTEGTGSSAPEQ